MRISLIVAMSRNHVIGRDNKLPWHLPADLKRFKELTLGHPVIMGRKTHESIGKLLPGRQNIVVTRQAGYRAEGCFVVHSLDQALQAAAGHEEVFVIGGSELFREALPRAHRIYVTRVEAEVEGNVFFPVLKQSQWRATAFGHHQADPSHAYDITFAILERVGTASHGPEGHPAPP